MNKNRQNHISTSLWATSLLVPLFAGCSLQRTHVPQTQAVPLFQNSGEMHFSASLQTLNRVKAKFGASFLNRYSFIIAGMFDPEEDYVPQNPGDTCFTCHRNEGNSISTAFGTFKKVKSRYSSELFAGAGFAKFRVVNSKGWDPQFEDMTVSSGYYRQLFFQANVGRSGKYFERAISSKISGYHIYDFKRWDGGASLMDVPKNLFGLYLEPALTFKIGGERLKAECQTGASLPLYQTNGLDNQKVWISLGTTFVLFR